MALKIKSILLDDFRGYDRLFLDGLSNLVIIVGPNAVGKTNVIEAIQLLTAGTSFRKPSWNELVSWGRESGHASIFLEDERRRIEHRVIVSGNERSYEVNGKRKNASSIRGTIPCVLFTPDDLQLVKASSSVRREAIDGLAIQLSKTHAALKGEYQQALRQRNLLIKEGIHAGDLFDSWDESFSILGARLCLSRWRLLDRLISHMREIYAGIVPGEEIDAVYVPSWMRQAVDERRTEVRDVPANSSDISLDEIRDRIIEASRDMSDRELARGVSLVGPHRDEVIFSINGKNARMFASQGQQRTIVLVMKLASVKLVNEIVGNEPVLLLDDVMSELDERHRSALIEVIRGNAQTFITTTNVEYFSKDIIEESTVVHMPIEGTRYI